MNKYEELWYETEGSNIKKFKLKFSLKFYKHMLMNSGINSTRMLYKKMGFDVPHKILGNLCLYPLNEQTWIKNNILNELNKEKIISLFVQNINNSLTENNDKFKTLFINSLMLVDGIKKGEFSNGILIITLDDNREFKFLKLLNTTDEILKFRNYCHGICYDYFKIHKDSDACIVTVFEKDLFNRKQYHSFIVENNVVLDYSRNIIMNYDKYKELFLPEVIMYLKGKEVLKNIEELEKNDSDFNELKKWCPVLKYALHKYLNDKNNKKILKKK